MDNKQGGGGGPKFSFESAFANKKVQSFEFVPSWSQESYQESQESYQQEAYQDGYQNSYSYYQQQEEEDNYVAYDPTVKPKKMVPPIKPKTNEKAKIDDSKQKEKKDVLKIDDSKQKEKKELPKDEPAAKKDESLEKKDDSKSKDAAKKVKPQEVFEIPANETVDISELSKEHLNIIFMGHVDAGKSTMGGHILLLTGMVDKRTMEKYEEEAAKLGRESWYLSWALDLNQEERNKGKTQEYGRGYFETESRRFTIIDAPGHKTFVPSMIEGAAQADVGILVISARKNEFEAGFEKGGQTREHALLAKTAGVKRIIMVINKMDDQTVNWSKERFDECVGKIMPFLKVVGFQKSDVDTLPISGYTGANMKDRVDPSVCSWYNGPALLELLDTVKLDRNYNGPLMMPIAAKLKDMGTIVLGKLESGAVKTGQTVMIMPLKVNAVNVEIDPSVQHYARGKGSPQCI
jgi:peptide chain release factor subunit 3